MLLININIIKILLKNKIFIFKNNWNKKIGNKEIIWILENNSSKRFKGVSIKKEKNKIGEVIKLNNNEKKNLDIFRKFI